MEELKEYFQEHWKQIALLGLIVMLVVGYLFFHHDNSLNQNDMFNNAQSSSSVKSAANANSSMTGKVCVDIKGAVNRPGVYHLQKGSRVEEAISAAGGSTRDADLSQVNLAKELLDQQIVQIPKFGEQLTNGATGSAGASGQDNSGDKININSATKEDLTKIDGIGDKKADKILEYRDQHGGFKSADDLKNISGFGDKTVEKLKDQLAV